MRAIIVDDEVVLVNELKKLLNEVGGFDIVGTFLDGMSALQSIEETQPEVAFLDIEMVGFNGIVLAEKLLGKLPHIEILFVTAFNHYATEAFEANAVDYILKPIRLERLKKAVNKLHSNKIASRNDQDLSIQCFGKFSVYIGEEPLRWSRAKQQELFAYLLQYEGRWVDKYKICDDLWKNSNSEQALANLQTAIWAIRKVLKNSGVSSVKIEYARDSYIMYIKDIRWDVRKFNEAYNAYLETKDGKYKDLMINLYQEGYLYYEDWIWCIIEQGKYVQKYNRLINSYSK